jgi:hypothetical protein
MLKIAKSDLQQIIDTNSADPKTFFDINNQPYEFVDQNHDLSILWNSDDKPKVILDLWHNSDNQSNRYDQWLEDKLVHVVTNVVSKQARSRVHFVDFLFNRTKAYYSNFVFGPDTVPWYRESQQCYFLDDLDTLWPKTKIFVAPNQIGGCTPVPDNIRIFRKKLVGHLMQYTNLGWISNPLLYSNKDPGIDSHVPTARFHKGYNPIHQDYYRRTFISIYGETIEYGDDVAVTEKTYDPLIKGHFILPFSSQGFVKHLKSMGIQFPSFIDYSYDDYQDDQARYFLYEKEISRLLGLPFDIWQKHWQENLHILKHNQKWFALKDYDRINFYNILATDCQG